MNIRISLTTRPNFCDHKGKVYLVKCPECEEVFRLVEDGWDWLVCKKCGFKIMKDQLLKLGKHWVVVKMLLFFTMLATVV